MRAVVLHRVDPSRNMRRFYRMDVQPDLFGFWLVISEWGRIGRRGQVRVVSFTSVDDADRALQRQRQLKERRGYVNADGSGGVRMKAFRRKERELSRLLKNRSVK